MSQRDSEAGSAFSPRAAASAPASSGMVMSAFSATYARRKARCGSSLAWRRPPLGLGAKLPRARTAFIRFTTNDTDTRKRRSGASRLAVLDKADNPLTQIQRIRLGHRESPPAESESRNTPYRNPPRFNLRIRRSRVGLEP